MEGTGSRRYAFAMNWPVALSPHFQELARALQIRPEDIREQFIRGGGHGGQKINKTSSTVLVEHLPTGLEVRCQEFREQSKNRLRSYERLILKIEELVRGNQSKLAREHFKIKKQKQRRNRRSKEKMLEDKRQRGETKEGRRPPMV